MICQYLPYALCIQHVLPEISPSSHNPGIYSLFDRVTELPEKIVYKLSYQIEGHTLEGGLLFGSFGQFGIVDVIGFHDCVLEEPFSSTAHHVKNWTFWDVSKDSVEGSPVNRSLHCTALTLEGLPLLDTSDTEMGIPGPAELLESILHAMIGEQVLSSHFFILIVQSQVIIIYFLRVCYTEM